MKNLIIVAVPSMMLSLSAIAASASEKFDPNTLPVFTGSIKNPENIEVFVDEILKMYCR